MTSHLGRHLATWETRAALADARAEAESRRAERAERIAAQGPPTLRELHEELALLHRRNAERHRTTARLHRSLVEQMHAWRGGVSVGLLLARAVSDASQCPSSAIVLLAGDGSTADFVATDGLAEAAQDLEFVHEEGPLHSVCTRGEPRQVSALEIQREWPHYGRELASLGVGTVVAAPLRAGSTVIGAVGLFDPPPSPRGGDALEGLAGGVTPVLLEQAGGTGMRGPSFALDGMREIHQAAGIVSAEAGCDLRAALALLRARAFVREESAALVARQVLAGELHLTL